MPPREWPPTPNPRHKQIAIALEAAMLDYVDVLESNAPLRGVLFDVKLRDDGRGVRTVVVSFQGESNR